MFLHQIICFLHSFSLPFEATRQFPFLFVAALINESSSMCKHWGEVFGELLVSLLTKPMIQSQSPVASSWIYVSVFGGTNQGEFNDG